MIKIIKYVKILTIISLIITFNSNSSENKILIKVNNEIITSLDILNELEYLQIINEEFRNIKKEEAFKISKNSLIKEKIKKIEIKRILKEIKINEKVLNNLLLNYFKEFEISSISDLEKFFLNKNINPNFVKEKIKWEILWNQLIYQKYKQNVKIDKQLIINDLKKNDKQSEFLISEILFNVDENENLNEKFNEIKKSIKEISFSQSALTYSISDTANKGGKVGWISESILSKQVYNELINLNVGEHTKPILVPGGFLILKLLDLRKISKNFDIDKEVKKIINEKTNQQLNRFSNIYFNKVKKDITINEL
jgi:peptidyl-prolyl cis-trans isomerase SurA